MEPFTFIALIVPIISPSSFIEKISWQVPQASKLIVICREMPTFKKQVWYGKCWLVLLDLLVNYAKFGWIPEEVILSIDIFSV